MLSPGRSYIKSGLRHLLFQAPPFETNAYPNDTETVASRPGPSTNLSRRPRPRPRPRSSTREIEETCVSRTDIIAMNATQSAPKSSLTQDADVPRGSDQNDCEERIIAISRIALDDDDDNDEHLSTWIENHDHNNDLPQPPPCRGRRSCLASAILRDCGNTMCRECCLEFGPCSVHQGLTIWTFDRRGKSNSGDRESGEGGTPGLLDQRLKSPCKKGGNHKPEPTKKKAAVAFEDYYTLPGIRNDGPTPNRPPTVAPTDPYL